jgi:hypothetical protein
MLFDVRKGRHYLAADHEAGAEAGQRYVRRPIFDSMNQTRALRGSDEFHSGGALPCDLARCYWRFDYEGARFELYGPRPAYQKTAEEEQGNSSGLGAHGAPDI